MTRSKLSHGWQARRVGDIVDILYGKGLPSSDRHPNGKYGVYGSNGIIARTDRWLADFPTIVIGRKGSVGAVNLTYDKSWPIDTAFYVKPKGSIPVDLTFLYYVLSQTDLASYTIVTAVPGINRDTLNSVEVPLPPLEEQRRIVARIEELTRPIEEAKRLRQVAREQAEKIMPAALAEVFTRGEREGWERNTLGNVLDLSNGKGITRRQMSEDGDYPVYGANGIIGRTNRALIEHDTITIGRVGACGAIKVARAPCWISDNAMYLSQINTVIGLRFLYYALQHINLPRLAKLAAQPSISQGPIKEQAIYYPDPQEQARIVAYLDSIQVKVEQLRGLQEETQAQLDALIPAVLGKAFGGL